MPEANSTSMIRSTLTDQSYNGKYSRRWRRRLHWIAYLPRLVQQRLHPVVYDSNGHSEFVKWGPLEKGDIRDRGRLDEVFSKYRPSAIIHFAAAIEVGESVRDPGAFYENNVGGKITLLRAAQAAGVNKIIFSSTCATYGVPLALPMSEAHSQLPINPYGRSKLIIEQILRDLDLYRGVRSFILRYFNAAGADPQGKIGEWHCQKLTPSRLPLKLR